MDIFPSSGGGDVGFDSGGGEPAPYDEGGRCNDSFMVGALNNEPRYVDGGGGDPVVAGGYTPN